MVWGQILAGVGIVLFLVIAYDLLQKKHAILHNFPIIGHFRYLLESIGPELRQYIVTSNNEERPFSRDQRRWVYASSKGQNNLFSFGTDDDLEQSPNHLIIKQAAFPLPDPAPTSDAYNPKQRIPCAKVLGEHRGRRETHRMESVVNISAMSFGSLSGPAIEAFNRGALIAECLHNSGEGGISPYHQQGGNLIWQIGTGYFGCRTDAGRFDPKKFVDVIDANRGKVRAIELKLSQGAKPGRGGMLPAAKVNGEIARIRGIPEGKDCASPSSHPEFRNVDEMLDFVERLADLSGLPVGIKSAVGETAFWRELARQMSRTERGVDFIVIDGGEGGTGAAPLVFSDHVSLPFKLAQSRIFREFIEAELHQKIVFIGSGKLGFPEAALLAFALGCDAVNVGREAMLAIGCIQAQRCHTSHCPTGVATQNAWLVRGLDPTHKGARLANYVMALRKEILQLCRACGVPHPALITTDDFEIVSECFQTRSAAERFSFPASYSTPSEHDCHKIRSIMETLATADVVTGTQR